MSLPLKFYSPYVRAGDFVFCSGQLGIGENAELLGSFEAQFDQAMTNLSSVLAEAGCSMANIVKATVFLVDAENFSRMNEIYVSYFPESLPARSSVIVKELPRGALVEIEAIAHIS